MVLGLSLSAFTAVHVVISLVAIASGLVVLAAMLGGRVLPGWTGFFLATTIATSVTGFLFPFERVLPSHVVGAISCVLLAVALLALYGRRLAGAWRGAYVATAVASLYLNVFVLIVQAFLKIGPLHALAPTQSDPAFVVAQAIALVAFAGLGYRALRAFRPAPPSGFARTA